MDWFPDLRDVLLLAFGALATLAGSLVSSHIDALRERRRYLHKVGAARYEAIRDPLADFIVTLERWANDEWKWIWFSVEMAMDAEKPAPFQHEEKLKHDQDENDILARLPRLHILSPTEEVAEAFSRLREQIATLKFERFDAQSRVRDWYREGCGEATPPDEIANPSRTALTHITNTAEWIIEAYRRGAFEIDDLGPHRNALLGRIEWHKTTRAERRAAQSDESTP